jgi:hypothetical protein
VFRLLPPAGRLDWLKKTAKKEGGKKHVSYTRMLREFGQQKAKMGVGMVPETTRLCNKSEFI